jgi:hypothetical protein
MTITLRHVALAALLFVSLYSAEGQTASNTAATSDTLSIQRMDHVAINVTDLQRSADWHEKVPWLHYFP